MVVFAHRLHAVEERLSELRNHEDTKSVLAGSHAYGPGDKERDVRRKRRK
jgi:hypothetical protein